MSQTQTNEAQAVADAIAANDRFVVVTHENPDGDALGSLLGCALVLRELGKDVALYLSGTAKGRLNTTFSVAPGFFATTGMRLLEGRDFTEHDDARSEMVAIVNDTAARLLFPGADPLDARVRFLLQTWDVRIVGVVNTSTLRTIGEPPQPVVYFPMRQHPAAQVAVYAKARTDAAVTAADVAAAVKAFDAALQPLRTRVGEEIVEGLFAARRLGVRLLVVFGSLALVLT